MSDNSRFQEEKGGLQPEKDDKQRQFMHHCRESGRL